MCHSCQNQNTKCQILVIILFLCDCSKTDININQYQKMQILNSNNRLLNKENLSFSPQKEIQKMKIQLNDRIFEYHKLEQDYAHEKTKLIMQFQKQKTRLSRTIKELRDKNIIDNQEWTNKIDQVRREKEASVASLVKHFQQQICKCKNDIKKQIQLDFQRELKTLRRENQKLTVQILALQRQKSQQKEMLVQNWKTTLKEREQQKDKTYSSLIEGIKNQSQQNILNLQMLYLAKQQSIRKLERQMQEMFKNNVELKLILQNTNQQLQLKNQQLLKEKQDTQKTLKAEKGKLQLILLKHQQDMKILIDKNEKQEAVLRQEFQQAINLNINLYNEQINKLKAEVTRIDSIYKRQEQLWEERSRKLFELYEKRDSKKQDIKTIESLEIQLLKKDFMIQRQRSQKQNCRLQLQNMDKIYGKMFIANSNLAKVKSKSFKIKKLKASYMLNSSDRSTIIQIRRTTTQDK